MTKYKDALSIENLKSIIKPTKCCPQVIISTHHPRDKIASLPAEAGDPPPPLYYATLKGDLFPRIPTALQKSYVFQLKLSRRIPLKVKTQ